LGKIKGSCRVLINIPEFSSTCWGMSHNTCQEGDVSAEIRTGTPNKSIALQLHKHFRFLQS